MALNFKWVENTKEDLYGDYVQAYNQGLTIQEIEDRLGISKGTQNTYFRHARHEGLLKLKKDTRPKYYYYSTWHEKWIVKRKTKNYLISIFCKSEEQAQRIVERLKLKNWSMQEVDNIRGILRNGGDL